MARRLYADARAGRLRNTEGRRSADAGMMRLSALPPVRASEVVVMVGASVTFGSNIAREEALPAQLAALAREAGRARSVYNARSPAAATTPRCPSPPPSAAAPSRSG